MHKPPGTDQPAKDAEPSEFLDSLKKGLLLGLVLLVLFAGWRMYDAANAPAPAPQVATAPQPQQPAPTPVPGPSATPGAAPEQEAAAPSQPPIPGVRLADFNGEDPSPDTRHVANWVVHTNNAKRQAFVIIDKKDARVYVFSPDGKLKESAPALLGSARGDDSFPGIGDKPLSAIKPYEKTTPAGRFVAEVGRNANHEDIVWVDYDAAVSMHRIRPTNIKERRLERLASLTIDDNRISFGCVNLPVSFYENVLSPTVQKYGAVIYVLPETKTPQQVFGSYDVLANAQQARTSPAANADPMQRVALKGPQAR
jgi:hypothetical protein